MAVDRKQMFSIFWFFRDRFWCVGQFDIIISGRCEREREKKKLQTEDEAIRE